VSGAEFILAINLVVAGLLAAAFLMISTYERTRVPGRWLGAAYLLGMAYFLAEASIPFFTDAKLPVVVAFAAFLAATAAFNVGIARKYGIAVPWRLFVGLFVVSLVAVTLVQDLPRHSFTRMMTYQSPYVVMQAIGAGLILSAPILLRADRIVAALLGLSALQFLSKPFLAYAVGGWGRNPQAYLTSDYAMISQALGAVFGIAVALGMLVILGRDLITDFAAKSETDTLSGLFNRRGFEERVRQRLTRSAEQNMPVCLVIADLDHFKSINDRFGHACGDRVIEAFATFLREAAAENQVAGRIGGEEFAVLLPATRLAAARLFAEGARSAFASLPVEGLPPGQRFTASFGVAERLPGEDVSDFMQRADEALYSAKRAGRDCVRVADSQIVPLRRPA
jgi:diguanylate cyclase (GGDEF)-like protein